MWDPEGSKSKHVKRGKKRRDDLYLEEKAKAINSLFHKDKNAHDVVVEDRVEAIEPARLALLNSVAEKTHGAFARSIVQILESKVTEFTVIGLSLLSAGILAYVGPEPKMGSFDHKLLVAHDYTFTIIFTVEIIMRVTGYGRDAFKDNWFRFDFVVVCICVVGLFIDHILWTETDIPVSTPALRVLRVLRAFRVVRLLRTTAYSCKSRSVLSMIAMGFWESRFIVIYLAGFVSMMSIFSNVWFKDGLTERCIVVALERTGISSRENLVSAEDQERLIAGEPWSAVSDDSPILAQPNAYCNPSVAPAGRLNLDELQSWGSHRCSDNQLCAKVRAQDINDRWAWMLTFDNLGSSVLSFLIVLLNQEWQSLLKGLIQGTSLAVLPFLIVASFIAFILVNFYSAILYIMYRHEMQRADAALGKNSETDVDFETHTEHRMHALYEQDARRKEAEEKDEKQRKQKEEKSNGRSSKEAEGDKKHGQAHDVREEKIEGKDSQQHDLVVRSLIVLYRKAAAAIVSVQEFKAPTPRNAWKDDYQAPRIPVPVWEWVLYICALLQLISGFVYAWYLGKWRAMERGITMPQYQETDEVMWGYWGGWGDVQDACQWVFYGDLVLKVVRYGGVSGYLGASVSHWADFMATVCVLVAAYTFKVPDMTGLRALRFIALFYVVDFGRLSFWSRDMADFYRRIMSSEGDIIQTFFFFIIVSLVLQHLSDGFKFENKFFGSWCTSMTSLLRLSSNEDLLNIIRARLHLDGMALVVMVTCFCLMLKTLVGKLVIAAMSNGLEQEEHRKILYQLFLASAHKKHPDLDRWLATDIFEHKSMFNLLKRAESVILSDPQAAAWYEKLIIARKEVGLRKGKGSQSVLWGKKTNSEQILEVANYMLDLHLEFHKQDVLEKEMMRKKWTNYTDASNVMFEEDFTGRMLRRILTVKKYLRLALAQSRIVFVIEAALFLPIASIAFLCTAENCWIEGILIQGPLLSIFSVECFLKMFAFGLIREREAYFRQVQNCFDFFILIMYWLSFSQVLDIPMATIYCTRVVRFALLLLNFKTVRWTLKCIACSLREVFYIFVALFCILSVLSPILIQSYSGRFRECNDMDSGDYVSAASCVGGYLHQFELRENESIFIYKQRSTQSAILCFDDLSSTLYSLLVLASQDGWSVTFDNGLGWSRAGLDHHQWSVVPLVVYQYFLYICFWPATVAVYVTTQRMYDGTGLEVAVQKEWLASIHAIKNTYSQYLTPEQVYWKTARALSVSNTFNRVGNLTVVINVVGTLVEFSLEDRPDIVYYIQIVNLCCLVVYIFEMTVMLLASPSVYLNSAWGMFDVLVNTISSVEVLAGLVSSNTSGSGVQVLRALRSVRILKALSSHTLLKVLTAAVYRVTLKSRGPLAIIILSIACFAAVSRQMFDLLPDGFVLSRGSYTHFNTFPGAMVLLSGAVLGGGMYPIITDIDLLCPSKSRSMANSDACTTSNEAARAFILIYALVCRFVFYPMLAATVVTSLLDEYDIMMSLIDHNDLHKFELCWMKLDPHLIGFIPVWKLRYLLDSLKAEKCSLHFDFDDEHLMRFFVTRLQDLLQNEPLYAGTSTRKVSFCINIYSIHICVICNIYTHTHTHFSFVYRYVNKKSV